MYEFGYRMDIEFPTGITYREGWGTRLICNDKNVQINGMQFWGEVCKIEYELIW